MKDYRMSLVISFPELKGDERIDGDDLWDCLSFILIMKVSYAGEWCCAWSEMDECGKRWNG